MAATEQDIPSGDAPPTPITLTFEELKVLRECRWNSIIYRGFPLGIISAAVARGVVVQGGYFRKYSAFFYTGMFGIGFFAGIGSYSETCARKIMALENSPLGDQFRAYRKKAGLLIDGASGVQPGEFKDEFPELSAPTDKPVTDPFDSPLNKRLEVSNKWDEIRKQSRQAHSSTSSEKGISYDDVRLRNRANQGDYNSLSPEEEAEIENMKQQSLSSDMASFNAQSFYTQKPSSLDFSKSDESRLSSLDNHHDNVVTEIGEKTRKSYTKGIPYKNKYGDDVV